MKSKLLAVHLVFAIAILLLSSTLPATTLEDILDTTLAFSSGDQLTLANTNGEIEVTSWDRNEIRIEAHKKARGSDDQDLQSVLDNVTVIIDEVTGGITIDTEFPRSGVNAWANNKISLSVDYLITVPNQANLDIETVNGRVGVRGVSGDIDIDTTNGGIEVTDSAGQVSAKSTNGGISIELAEVDASQSMTLRTTNGGVSLALPSSVQANLTARTTNGTIETDFPITMQGRLSGTRLEGEINGGGGEIDIKTTNGGIEIREI